MCFSSNFYSEMNKTSRKLYLFPVEQVLNGHKERKKKVPSVRVKLLKVKSSKKACRLNIFEWIFLENVLFLSLSITFYKIKLNFNDLLFDFNVKELGVITEKKKLAKDHTNSCILTILENAVLFLKLLIHIHSVY